MQKRMTCQIPTDVMSPTIPEKSIVAIDTEHYYSNAPSRWDVAVFTSPEVEQMQFDLGHKRKDRAGGGIINAAAQIFEQEQKLIRPHIFYVKRIVGLPGERIRFTQTQIFLNDKELHIPRDISHCYSSFDDFSSYKFGAEEYQIPEYSLFVLSDNLRKGKDSRYIGGVSIHNLVGKVVL